MNHLDSHDWFDVLETAWADLAAKAVVSSEEDVDPSSLIDKMNGILLWYSLYLEEGARLDALERISRN